MTNEKWNEILNKEKFKSKYLFARNYKKRNEEVGEKKRAGVRGSLSRAAIQKFL